MTAKKLGRMIAELCSIQKYLIGEQILNERNLACAFAIIFWSGLLVPL